MKLLVQPFNYSNKPLKKVGNVYKTKNGKYYYQRKSDVLFVNPSSGLISTNPAGFILEDNDELEKRPFKEFCEVLNQTIFKMNILNGEFTIEE